MKVFFVLVNLYNQISLFFCKLVFCFFVEYFSFFFFNFSKNVFLRLFDNISKELLIYNLISFFFMFVSIIFETCYVNSFLKLYLVLLILFFVIIFFRSVSFSWYYTFFVYFVLILLGILFVYMLLYIFVLLTELNFLKFTTVSDFFMINKNELIFGTVKDLWLFLSTHKMFFVCVDFTYIFDNFLVFSTFDMDSVNFDIYFFNSEFMFQFDNVGLFSADWLGLLFLFLTNLITFCVFLAAFSVLHNTNIYLLLLTLTQFILVFFFLSQNLFCFFIFFEMTLIPLFLLIGWWGSRARKIHAVFQFFLYTFFGGLLLLFSFLSLILLYDTSNISVLSWYFCVINKVDLLACENILYSNNYFYLFFDNFNIYLDALKQNWFFHYFIDFNISRFFVFLNFENIVTDNIFWSQSVFSILTFIDFTKCSGENFLGINLYSSSFLNNGFIDFVNLIKFVKLFASLDEIIFLLERYVLVILCIFVYISFAIKIPVYPFHIWLPEAHVEAPTCGSMLLAGVLLKLGTFGLLKILIPFFSNILVILQPVIFINCLLGIVLGSGSTIIQVDLKKTVAYSSVAHMSMIVLGCLTFNIFTVTGSIIMMINHGFVSTGLFFLVGSLYDRYKTRNILYYGGLVSFMPVFTMFFFLFTLANVSFPGTFGFVGEFFILLGLGIFNFSVLCLSFLGVFLSVFYSFWLYNRVCFFFFKSFFFNKVSDLSTREIVVVVFLIFFVLFLGIFPFNFIWLLEVFFVNDFLSGLCLQIFYVLAIPQGRRTLRAFKICLKLKKSSNLRSRFTSKVLAVLGTFFWSSQYFYVFLNLFLFDRVISYSNVKISNSLLVFFDWIVLLRL